MADRIGQQLGNYRLTRLLGRGGFAEVYLGEHIHLNTQAAVKVLYTQLASEDIEGFRTEARTVARLEHPNIVRVLEFGIEGAVPFLVMSYAPNGSLRQRHPRGTPLPLPLILQYVRQVADALQYAHEEKLIHRDIKPENMLLGRRNEVLLSDFGIAIVSQTSRSKSVQDVIGTVAYMAPEMLQGRPRTASDQYALGIVVYEWLCGERPFHGGFTELASQHMFVPPPSLREKMTGISPDLERVVMTALAKDPQQRYASVRAFATALEQASQSASYQSTVYASPALPPTQPTFPNAPRQQPATPTIANQFQQPPAATSTPSQPYSSPMLSTPSSPSGQWSRPTVLPPNPSSQHGLQTPASGQPFQPTVVAAPSAQPIPPTAGTPFNPAFQPTVAAVPSNGSSQSATVDASSTPSLPPTQLAASANQPFQPTVLASPPTEKPLQPDIAGSLPGETKSSRKGISRRMVIGGLAGLVGVATVGGGIALWSHNSRPPARQTSVINDLQSVVWSGSQFVAVGENGTILTSPDGSTWTTQKSGTSKDLLGIVWSDSQFVAVGFNGTILTSANGTTWTTQNSSTSKDLFSVAWSGKQFAAVGRYQSSATVLTSPDGSTWSVQNVDTPNDLYEIIWADKQFVAVGTGETILTSADGSTWSAQSLSTTAYLAGIAWSGSQFVAVGYQGAILTSPDGSTWTTQQSGISNNLESIAWSGSQFVAVGNSGTIFTSPDGSSWTAQHSGTSIDLIGIASSGSQLVAVGGNYTAAIILTSPDGSSWTAHNAGTA